MRLINASTMKMEQMFPPNIKRYIILSHRWGTDEVSYQDFNENPDVVYKPSYYKIKRMAVLAKRLHCNYFWVDTCCINKMDSPELSESINSMFQWYRDAHVCIAYLADVPSGSGPREITDSEWFDRGWTLQELVAPHTVHFYDAAWSFIGDKTKFLDVIWAKTNVSRRMLANQASLTDYSLARRMSWAANRVTTRIEDTAYCLLGIFQVNMPLLYGEGTNAFRRLQEEIVKYSNDLTIFAWRVPKEYLERQPAPQTSTEPAAAQSGLPANIIVPPSEKKPGVFDGTASLPYRTKSPDRIDAHQRSRSMDYRMHFTTRTSTGTKISAGSSSPTPRTPTPGLCLFATSPKQFAETPSLQPFSDDSENFSVTNRGLFVAGPVYLRLVSRSPVAANSSMSSASHYVLLLGSQNGTIVGIYLTKTGPNLFQRNCSLDIAVINQSDVDRLTGERVSDFYLMIDQRPADATAAQTFRTKSVHVPSTGLCNMHVKILDTAPTHLWDVQDRLFLRPKAYVWTRYDMVLAIKCAVTLRNANVALPLGGGSGGGSGSGNDDNNENSPHRRVDFVVLCHYRRHQDTPRLSIFRESDYPGETEMLMARRAPNNSLIWADFGVFCPHISALPDSVLVDVGTAQKSCWYRISLQCTEGQVNLEYSQPHLHSILFDIRLLQGR